MTISHKDSVIELLSLVITKDEYNDSSQASEIYNGTISDFNYLKEVVNLHYKSGNFLEIGCGSRKSLESLPITHAIEPNPVRRRKGKAVVDGYAEAIPFEDSMFSTVLMWGTWCFLRSEKEALIEINRVLEIGGIYIFDAIIETDLPIIRVDEPRNLIVRIELFGFKLIELRNVPISVGQKRIILAFSKIREFDWKYLCLPQLVGGKINNYITSRDWYLR